MRKKLSIFHEAGEGFKNGITQYDRKHDPIPEYVQL